VQCGHSIGGVATFAAMISLGVIFSCAGIPTYVEATRRLRNSRLRTQIDPGGLQLIF
jgi:hypothetical protein